MDAELKVRAIVGARARDRARVRAIVGARARDRGRPWDSARVRG